MRRGLVFLALVSALLAADDEYVFKSDVSLVRVDAQVVDRNNRAITNLELEDFIVRENGNIQEIKNFAREDMPMDVLLLLDVSGSMRPHIERVAAASDNAVRVLGKDDRIGIMVFDRQSRVRLPLRAVQGDISYAFDELLRQETFNGGTDITRALYDAASYMKREGRREARRAIVILTDDQTERNRDERGVGSALASGDIVLSALIAPDAMGSRGGISWPSGGGGPLGGIILGPRRGGRFPGGGPVITRGHTSSAGTRTIARQSGGDSFNVDESSAFENTLERLRQRYTLYFQLPEGVKPGQERDIQVALTSSAQRRYSGAEVHFRRQSDASEPGRSAPVVVSSRTDEPTPGASEPSLERRPAEKTGGWRRATTSGGEGGSSGPQVGILNPEPAVQAPQQTPETPKRGGWRRVKPGETP
jgi:VWFA-related protein